MSISSLELMGGISGSVVRTLIVSVYSIITWSSGSIYVISVDSWLFPFFFFSSFKVELLSCRESPDA